MFGKDGICSLSLRPMAMPLERADGYVGFIPGGYCWSMAE